MKVVLIGAGRLATNLGHALFQNGHLVTCVYSRTMASAKQLADAIGAEAVDDFSRLPLQADVFVVAVSDSALPSLLPKLAEGRSGQLVVHTAGSLPMSILGSAFSRYGVFYPMQTFSKERLVDFSEVSLFVEASSQEVLSVLRQLAESVTPHVYELSSDDRRQLHLAAVFACNFVNHCYTLSAELLAAKGLPFSVMLPLVDETARKVHQMSPLAAQTGPAVRYDENVISMQSQMLASDPMMRDIYERMSESIHQTHMHKS